MLVAESRPRNLKWYHAGPLLFGDWGTSRLYVLGLAFYYTAHASALYLAAMGVLMIGVAWAYTVICRTFREGGGVYTVARQLSHTLSVLGATLLLCDYVVTAALSIVDGLHYFGVAQQSRGLIVGLAILVIAAIGMINWFGARSAGRFALIVALAALGMSALIALVSWSFAQGGARAVTWGHPSLSGFSERWQSFVSIVLALSGVEAVANMTGLMREPVPRTAKKTIWPVLAEVVLLNLFFGVAISGLPQLAAIHQPDHVSYEVLQHLHPEDAPPAVKEYRDTAVKVLAVAAGQRLGGETLARLLGLASGVVFGALLLSAANTAIMAMVSVLYAMGQDRELPRPLTRLNYSGVPWFGLLICCVVPAGLLLVISDVGALSHLYAVGVCGAITISILGCVVNLALPIRLWERILMGVVGMVMLAIETTIVLTKLEAAAFAGALVFIVLVVRQALVWSRPKEEIPRLVEPPTGWLAEIKRPIPPIDPRKPRIMLAARGRYQAEFAVDLARRRGAVLYAVYVRTLRLIDVQPGKVPLLEDDPGAQEALGTVATLAHQASVPFVPIYVTATDIAPEILDYAVTEQCDTLIMGKSRRSLFSRKLAGDVVAEVARHLPDNVSLITRSADAPFVPGETPRPEPREGAGREGGEAPPT
jgi:amino acid transporter/nucleotide-binding universal stress UspA family protein